METFLFLNGYAIDAPVDSQEQIILRVDEQKCVRGMSLARTFVSRDSAQRLASAAIEIV